MDSIISTFHIDWKIIIAQGINFGVVFVVLYFFALKPLNKLMAERAEKIAKGLDDAKENKAMLAATNTEYEKVLSKAKIEANSIFQAGKKEAEDKKVAMLEQSKKEVAGIIENGKKTLEAEKINMVEEAKKEIAGVAIKIAEKLLESKLDVSYEEKIIKEFNSL